MDTAGFVLSAHARNPCSPSCLFAVLHVPRAFVSNPEPAASASCAGPPGGAAAAPQTALPRPQLNLSLPEGPKTPPRHAGPSRVIVMTRPASEINAASSPPQNKMPQNAPSITPPAKSPHEKVSCPQSNSITITLITLTPLHRITHTSNFFLSTISSSTCLELGPPAPSTSRPRLGSKLFPFRPQRAGIASTNPR